MIKVSGKTKRIVVVGTTLLISCIAGYVLIDWVWLGNESLKVSGATDTQDKLFIIASPFLALFLGLDHWYKPKGKGIPKFSILSFFYYACGIGCFALCVSVWKENNDIPTRLVLPLSGLFFLLIGYWCHRNEEDVIGEIEIPNEND